MSETAVETTPSEQPETEKPATGDKDWAAEAEKWKSLARKHEAEAKAGKTAAAKLAEIEAANATDLEKAVKAARDEGRTEAATAANSRLVSAEARAIAAELKFKNPALAIKAVDLSDVSVSPDGEVDAAAIRAALDTLATDEPYLVGETAEPVPSFDGGARRSAPPSDPRMADLAQIEADLKAGRRK